MQRDEEGRRGGGKGEEGGRKGEKRKESKKLRKKEKKSLYVKRDIVRKIITAWLITVPAAAVLSASLFYMIKGIMN